MKGSQVARRERGGRSGVGGLSRAPAVDNKPLPDPREQEEVRSGPPLRGALLAAGIRTLVRASIPAPQRTARWLLEGILDISSGALIAHPDTEVSAANVARYAEAIRRCLRHEPLQYILQQASFCGLTLTITPEVLIPRSGTERLVEVALQTMSEYPHPNILDIGTGSGCIALAIKHMCRASHVRACDVSDAALRVAKGNACRLGLDVEFFSADLLSPMFRERAMGSYDLVVSNPPYIVEHEMARLPANVRDYEPRLALCCGQDPLTYYRALADNAQLIRPRGYLVMEVHTDYVGLVRQFFARSGFTSAMQVQDLTGHPRIVVAQR